MKHSREPWFVGPHYRSDVMSESGRIAECGPGCNTERGIADAARIVACVNACRGMSNESITGGAIEDLAVFAMRTEALLRLRASATQLTLGADEVTALHAEALAALTKAGLSPDQILARARR
jgi:hypothetical protein